MEPAASSAPIERGWRKLFAALLALLFVPAIPQVRAFLPIDQPFTMYVTALAACGLVGWWAGGRAVIAIVWVALAVLVVAGGQDGAIAYQNLVRGWSLLLAGAFGLICLVEQRRPFFPRAMAALCSGLVLAAVMSLIGPVTYARARQTFANEFGRRNAETMATLTAARTEFEKTYPDAWHWLTDRVPQISDASTDTEKQLAAVSDAGAAAFPALLSLESLAAMGLAWATYHRLGRARLGPPLAALRDFRFNDQLVWGLIAGLVSVLFPTVAIVHDVGRNLLVFFGALYAVRGFAVISWFFAPNVLALALGVGFLMLWAPVLNWIAALGFLVFGLSALGLGLGDTWADWRGRPRPTH
ncbi:MAG TPA: DUF2232 domain-containing protein [Gemmatimonadaceae bacterium]|nr:DUF2232 domain-containing protein [Gemmatimonadaceae bacterium]